MNGYAAVHGLNNRRVEATVELSYAAELQRTASLRSDCAIFGSVQTDRYIVSCDCRSELVKLRYHDERPFSSSSLYVDNLKLSSSQSLGDFRYWRVFVVLEDQAKARLTIFSKVPSRSSVSCHCRTSPQLSL